MATSRRRKNLNLIEQLQNEPYRFDFFQAVRVLESAARLDNSDDEVADEPAGGLARPDQESVHFSVDPGLQFHGSDVSKVSQKRIHSREHHGGAALQWQMEVAMLGLTGSQGVMPIAFSELVLAELRKKNDALSAFFDLFNHRIVSLFYESWHKYQMGPEYERAKQTGGQKPDLFTDALLSVSGLGLSELRYRSAVNDEHIARYAGHFGRGICSAESLRSAIEGMFGFDTEIQQFKGEWYELSDDVRCRLPGEEHPEGVNNQLGMSAVIGSVCYQIQNKFAVVVTPRSREEFMELSPGSKRLEELKSFIRMSVGAEQDYEIEVHLEDSKLPVQELLEPDQFQGLLGWNTYINPERVDGRNITIRLSQDIPTPVDALPLAT
ncbi:MAG: type VI secretion system baseplate subunit TssG [Oceanospirillaceae bacterium]|nr:type VI secretion system baseplate subunit TssG [Oceanospirillaceae bacterium]MBT13959.1 type VI secretion system baseplate subunit TssG [Oceanospirillaceae bacterium]|tara:strand:+ start:25998 stop:27137 length:1140 start_codon:yes stop_codon:yes gene_type:complete